MPFKREIEIIRQGFRFHCNTPLAKLKATVATLQGQGKTVATMRTADGVAVYVK